VSHRTQIDEHRLCPPCARSASNPLSVGRRVPRLGAPARPV